MAAHDEDIDTIIDETPAPAHRRGANAVVIDEADVAEKRARRKVTFAMWGRFVKRLSMVLLRPATFWERVRDEEIPMRELLWPHIVVMLGIRALAGFAGAMFDGASVGAATLSGLSSFFSWVALIWVFALLVGSIATARGASIKSQHPIRFAAYGLAPVFMVGVLATIPLPYVTPIAELIAMPYTFYVMGLAVVPLLGVPEKRAPGVVGLLCGTLLILWALMPTLVPAIVEIVTR